MGEINNSMILTIVGPLGYETAFRLYKENEAAVKKRFAPFFVRQFEEIAEEKVMLPERYDYAEEIGEGGLYGALWKMGEELGTGLEVHLDDIPIRQETVEILELFDESPYECSSRGSFLVAIKSPTAEELIGADCVGADDAQARAPRIGDLKIMGNTKAKKSRIIVSGEGERFLTPPSRQAKDIADRQSHR